MLSPLPRPLFRLRGFLCLPVMLLLAACSPDPAALAPTPEVGVWTVRAQRLAMHQTLPGRTVAHMVSDVRPQVGGIIQQRLFDEGQDVEAGQLLYRIDPAIYQAAYDNAKGALAQAQAAVLSARPKAQRYANLAKLDAVSQQDLEEAVATLRQNEAAVMVAQATLQTARINLDYTRVSAPIGGRIGASTYTPGALVTAGQTTALATIQQLDPIYVDVTQSSAELLALRKQLDSGALTSLDGKVPVRIQLEDDSLYEHSGTLEFVGTSVDTGTGNVVLRALVPNPDRLLLPGAYVRAILPVAIDDKAILAPQSAVGRNTRGEATVRLVGDDGRLIERTVRTSGAQQDQWVITAGLQAGEQLVVEGGSKVQVGQAVKTYAVAAAAPEHTDSTSPPTAQGN
ncbi:efflux RND transporter periplasmic adaptor subunit [Stutzerimonas kirkiae]|uniref:efflux RND transporter periplasmic adaptor subunit n=1 Tax=Stutzerimonas kirkiae TaxID=2211392 RepID=UPI00103852F8|nr:efflux RND transporter periplasmic adaptor subunit [Stutzerimonas kirkiae]